MERLIDTDALTTAMIDAYGLDPERLRDVLERIPAAECDDVISRSAALDAIGEQPLVWTDDDDFAQGKATQWEYDIDAIKALPSAQPYSLDEWCTDCKEYDSERHCCPRYNRVIRDAMKMRKRGKWIIEKDATGATYGRCSVCGIKQYGGYMNFCYECGADMREGEEE